MRSKRRRRLATAVCAGVGCLAMSGCGLPADAPDTSRDMKTAAQGAPAGQPSSSEHAASVPAGESTTVIRYPESGPRTWSVVGGQSEVVGAKGQLLRFHVTVEQGIEGIDPAQFGAAVFATLADPRGWTAGGSWRLQRVDGGQSANFTIYLATPATRDKLCQVTYDRYTSCRQGNAVVLNVARWASGVPNYTESLAVYRQYMVNHEVGHRLGLGHELCPAAGGLAPVMEQQTLGLHGCLANAWPYVNNARYTGPPGVYDDQIPR
jgi:Protein of unknown function (DUF3152)